LSEFPFVHLYKGWIPSRFIEVEDRQFSFVHIDVDLYEPILDSLNFFPKLVKGGVIVFDDYGITQFPGG
jgi:O-methyltransferase